MYLVFRSVLLVIVNFSGVLRVYWFLLFCCCWYIYVFLCICFTSLHFLDYLLPVFLDIVNLFKLDLPSSTFFRAGFVGRYDINLVRSWILYFLHLCWLKVLLGIIVWAGDDGLLESAAHLSWTYLLTFRVPTEKSGVILRSLTLYVTWSFSLEAFNIFSLFCMLNALIIMCQEDFFSSPICLVFCMLPEPL